MSPVLLANLFALLFLLNTFPIIRLYQTEKFIFNMGFWTAIAGFVFPGYFTLFIMGVISLFILRSFSVRELGQMVAGLVCATILIGTLFFLSGEMGSFQSSFAAFKPGNLYYLFDFFSFNSALTLLVTYVLIMIVAFNFYKVLAKQSIREQKKLKLTYWLMFLTIPGLVMEPSIAVYYLLSLAIPVSIILGIVIAKWQLKLAAEFIHLLVVMGILYLHFQ